MNLTEVAELLKTFKDSASQYIDIFAKVMTTGKRQMELSWVGPIMRKNNEEHCVTALEWRPAEGKRDIMRTAKNNMEEKWLRMKDKQLDGSHG